MQFMHRVTGVKGFAEIARKLNEINSL